MSTPSPPLLTAANQYLSRAKYSTLTVAGLFPIQTSLPYVSTKLCKPSRFLILTKCWTPRYLYSSLPWNCTTLSTIRSKIISIIRNNNLHHEQVLWSFLLTHVDSHVDHLISSSMSIMHGYRHRQVVDYPQTNCHTAWIV